MPQTSHGPPQWLIVVRRDKPDVYASLHYSFDLDERVRVILDRRRVERRLDVSPSSWRRRAAERRRRQRRTPSAPTEAAFARHAGFSLIERRRVDSRTAGSEARQPGPADGRLTAPPSLRQ